MSQEEVAIAAQPDVNPSGAGGSASADTPSSSASSLGSSNASAAAVSRLSTAGSPIPMIGPPASAQSALLGRRPTTRLRPVHSWSGTGRDRPVGACQWQVRFTGDGGKSAANVKSDRCPGRGPARLRRQSLARLGSWLPLGRTAVSPHVSSARAARFPRALVGPWHSRPSPRHPHDGSRRSRPPSSSPCCPRA